MVECIQTTESLDMRSQLPSHDEANQGLRDVVLGCECAYTPFGGV